MITMAVSLLRAANIFPLKDFKDWEAVPVKTFPALKTFFHAAFTKLMTAISLGHTSGRHGYTNANLYDIFNTAQESDSDSTTMLAAATTNTMPGVSTIGNTYTKTVPTEITNAISQLASNQTAMMTQMAALHITPPVQQNNVQGQATYTGGYNNRGQDGRGRSRRSSGGRGRGGRGYNAFAELTARNATVGGGHNAIPPITGTQATMVRGAPNSNIVNAYNNWNYCYTCGHDIEDGHTSKTCTADWRKQNHQEGCTRANVQQYVAAGYTPCMKAAHKTQFKNM